MMVRFCLLLLLPLCISCKPLIRSEVSAVNSGGCGYIQWKERQLFTQASRIQDTLFGMLHDLDASAQEYEKKTGKALSFFHRDSTDFQDFLVAHKEKTVNFRSLQDELHKVFGKLQTINLINYSHCPNNKHLEIDGMNYGMLKDKKPSSCANYHNQINAEKSKVAELEKALITSSHDALSDAEEVAQMDTEANKLKSLSNKLLYSFLASETITVAMIGAYPQVYAFLGSATPITIAGLEAADFILSLAWIYTSTKETSLRLAAQKLRSKYMLTGLDNQTVLQEVNKLKDQAFFLEDVFSKFCRGKGA